MTRRFFLREAEDSGHISFGSAHWWSLCCINLRTLQQTVDGRNPAPVDRSFISLFTGFYTSQVVQDFFHQQYHWNVPQTLSYLEGNPFILLCFGDIWFVCSWGLERKFLRIKSWSAGASGNGRIPPMTEIL